MKNNKRVILLIVLGIIFLVAAAIMNFVLPYRCQDYECFKEKMEKCSKAKFVNEAKDASWKYEVLGIRDKKCAVEVTLLQPKVSGFEIENLRGLSMICEFEQHFSGYPEKDLTKCHGVLKEELQTLIINKLHKYILDNIGEISENLKSFSNSS